MTTRPKTTLVSWLEHETGKTLEPLPAVHTQDRHVSVRLPTDLYERVQAIAGTRGESVSQVLRRLVSESIARLDHPDAGAIDTANAALQELRRHSA